jgi:cullin 1
MEGMVTDLQLAREKQTQFEDWMRDRGKAPAVDISVTVSLKERSSMPGASCMMGVVWCVHMSSTLTLSVWHIALCGSQVLTTGFWPTYKSIELALPREMVEGVELFKEFYEAENKHRWGAGWAVMLLRPFVTGQSNQYDSAPVAFEAADHPRWLS